MAAARLKTFKRIAATVAAGFVLQALIPYLLAAAGFFDAAIWAILPGLLPVLWMTGGWFRELSTLGSAIIVAVNTIVYSGAVCGGVLVWKFCSSRPKANCLV